MWAVLRTGGCLAAPTRCQQHHLSYECPACLQMFWGHKPEAGSPVRQSIWAPPTRHPRFLGFILDHLSQRCLKQSSSCTVENIFFRALSFTARYTTQWLQSHRAEVPGVLYFSIHNTSSHVISSPRRSLQ